MSEIDEQKRQFIAASSTATAGFLLSGSALANTKDKGGKTTMPIIQLAPPSELKPKPLAFDPAKLKGLSVNLIESHWSNNYGGSVKTLNALRQQLAQALDAPDTPPFVYNGLKREHLIRTGSVVLHELYFDNLGGDCQADNELRSLIAKSFGTFDRWETEFRKIAQGLGGGSGWVILGYNHHLHILENFWMWDHAHFPAHTTPLL